MHRRAESTQARDSVLCAQCGVIKTGWANRAHTSGGVTRSPVGSGGHRLAQLLQFKLVCCSHPCPQPLQNVVYARTIVVPLRFSADRRFFCR